MSSGNPYASATMASNDTDATQLPTVGVTGSVGVSSSTFNASVQVTGVLILLLVAALVVMSRTWPVI